MKTTPKIRLAIKLVPALLTMAVFTQVARASLLVSYDFNEGSGTVAANSGTLGSAADGTLSTGTTWSTNTPSETGFSFSNPGVSGQKLSTGSVVSGLNGLTTMTVVLWWNPTTGAFSASDRLISNLGGSAGFDLTVDKPNSGTGTFTATDYCFRLNLDATGVYSGNVSTSGWQFIAFTYDGTLTNNNVRFYLGTTDSSVAQLGVVASANAGALGTSTNPLDVGNTELNTVRNPSALFDNVQIYDTVLTLGDLEALRTFTIPEPSTYAFFAGSGMLFLACLRRKIRAPRIA